MGLFMPGIQYTIIHSFQPLTSEHLCVHVLSYAHAQNAINCTHAMFPSRLQLGQACLEPLRIGSAEMVRASPTNHMVDQRRRNAIIAICQFTTDCDPQIAMYRSMDLVQHLVFVHDVCWFCGPNGARAQRGVLDVCANMHLVPCCTMLSC